MGNRAWIQVQTEYPEETVSFYGHWAGEKALEAVQDVLSATDRIGDRSYLAAQIFHAFTTLGNYDGKLSFGIYAGDAPDEDDHPTVYVYVNNGHYRYDGITYDQFGKELFNENAQEDEDNA